MTAAQVRRTPEPELLVWDWREQPPWDEIEDAQRRGLLYLRPVTDTGEDCYAVVVSAAAISEEEAQKLWVKAVEDA